ncbi:MAG: hypothetical protein ACRD0U_16270, partial [Acidimicrobiales bacterium]
MGGGAGQPVGGGPLAVLGPHRGPVGFEQLLFDPFQLAQEDPAVDGVEDAAHLHLAFQAAGGVEPASVPVPSGSLLGHGVVGAGPPVGHRPGEVGETQRLVPGEQVGHLGLVGSHQQVGAVHRHGAGGQGGGGGRHGGQGPG